MTRPRKLSPLGASGGLCPRPFPRLLVCCQGGRLGICSVPELTCSCQKPLGGPGFGKNMVMQAGIMSSAGWARGRVGHSQARRLVTSSSLDYSQANPGGFFLYFHQDKWDCPSQSKDTPDQASLGGGVSQRLTPRHRLCAESRVPGSWWEKQAAINLPGICNKRPSGETQSALLGLLEAWQ